MRVFLLAAALVVLALGAVAAALTALVSHALAADAASRTVDLQPLLGWALECVLAVIAAPLLAGVTLLARVLHRRWGLDIDARHRQALDDAIWRGIGFARHLLEERVRGMPPVEVRSELARLAIEYAVERVPEAVAHFGVTPESLRARVLGELGQLIGDDAAPVAPSAAAPTPTPVPAPVPAPAA